MPSPDLGQSTRAAVELALNLPRIYKAVRAFPYISGVPDVDTATRGQVLAGYERLKASRNIGSMCADGEHRLRHENRVQIEALCELVEDVFQNGRSQGFQEGAAENEARYHNA
jgi:hypothetical protein